MTQARLYNEGNERTSAMELAEKAIHAALKHLEWIDKEKAGPDYQGLSRDTHPEGERIWRRWWDEQLDLCADTERLCREVVTEHASRNTRNGN